jgi:hypothetical protein
MSKTLVERALRTLHASSGQESATAAHIAPAGGDPAAGAVDAVFETAREQLRARAPANPSAGELMRQKLALDILEEGRKGLAEVARKKTADGLSELQEAGLEAIVRLFGRPSLLVQDGTVASTTPEWADPMKAARSGIETALECVGRINVPELGAPGYQGTGFLVQGELLMTNRHVALKFAEAHAGGWRVRGGLRPSIDFKREHQRSERREHKIIAIDLVHPDPLVDLALLRVEARDQDGQALPEPLRLDSDEEVAAAPRTVYVVGYPAYDWRNDASAIEKIFGDVFNVKRFAPGNMMGLRQSGMHIAHDCSTLGGNSGSCMIDFGTHHVLGLHFSGAYLEENRAASIPRLRQDPLLRDKGLNFT